MNCANCFQPIGLFADHADIFPGCSQNGMKVRGYYVYEGAEYCVECWLSTGLAQKAADEQQRSLAGADERQKGDNGVR